MSAPNLPSWVMPTLRLCAVLVLAWVLSAPGLYDDRPLLAIVQEADTVREMIGAAVVGAFIALCFVGLALGVVAIFAVYVLWPVVQWILTGKMDDAP